MAAFIDEDMNISRINTLGFNASSANVEYPAVILTFFVGNGRPSSCIDGLCTSCSETLSLESLPVQVSLC